MQAYVLLVYFTIAAGGSSITREIILSVINFSSFTDASIIIWSISVFGSRQ